MTKVKLLIIALSFVVVTAGLTLTSVISAPDKAYADCIAAAAKEDGKSNTSDAKKDWRYVDKCRRAKKTQVQQGAQNAASGDSAGAPGGEKDWLTPGTHAYDVAKRAFDFMTGTLGTSGAAAAAFVGAARAESNFIEDRAETGGLAGYHVKYSGQDPAHPGVKSACGGGMLCFGMDNREPVLGMAWYVPSGKNKVSGFGGGGIIQETPYTQFTNSEWWGKVGPGWDVRNQVGYNFSTRIWNRAMERGCITYGGKAPSYSGKFTIEEWLKSTDPAKAEDILYTCNLKGYTYQPHRQDLARQSNEVFNKDNIPADPSKWQFSKSSGGGGANLSGNTGGDNERAKVARNSCKKCAGDAKDLTNGDGPDGASDAAAPGGNGSWHYYNELPDDLKKLAPDPTRFGFKQGECNDVWNHVVLGSGGRLNQCVALSRVLGSRMWTKNGRPMEPVPTANGGELAASFARQLGGSVTKQFSKGAIFSIKGGIQMCGGSLCGHTGIALEKFSDGSVFVIEQNTRHTGAHHGTKCDWEYRIVKPATANQFEYYSPAQAGYSLSMDGSATISDPLMGADSMGMGDASDVCRAKANGIDDAAAGSDALKVALSQVGKPYALGATGPDAFDCSGLMVYAFKTAGHDLDSVCSGGSRTADQQMQCVAAAGNLKRDKAQCEVGDMVFFQRGGSGAGHVGMLKDKASMTMVHASRPGVGVVETSVSSSEHAGKFLGCGLPKFK